MFNFSRFNKAVFGGNSFIVALSSGTITCESNAQVQASSTVQCDTSLVPISVSPTNVSCATNVYIDASLMQYLASCGVSSSCVLETHLAEIRYTLHITKPVAEKSIILNPATTVCAAVPLSLMADIALGVFDAQLTALSNFVALARLVRPKLSMNSTLSGHVQSNSKIAHIYENSKIAHIVEKTSGLGG